MNYLRALEVLDIDRNEQKLSFELTTMDRNDFFVKPKYY